MITWPWLEEMHLKINTLFAHQTQTAFAKNTEAEVFVLLLNLYKIIKTSQYLCSGDSAHLVFRADNCTLLVDLPDYFITGSDFEAVHSVIMAAK